jgi:hypothetical protein
LTTPDSLRYIANDLLTSKARERLVQIVKGEAEEETGEEDEEETDQEPGAEIEEEIEAEAEQETEKEAVEVGAGAEASVDE